MSYSDLKSSIDLLVHQLQIIIAERLGCYRAETPPRSTALVMSNFGQLINSRFLNLCEQYTDLINLIDGYHLIYYHIHFRNLLVQEGSNYLDFNYVHNYIDAKMRDILEDNPQLILTGNTPEDLFDFIFHHRSNKYDIERKSRINITSKCTRRTYQNWC